MGERLARLVFAAAALLGVIAGPSPLCAQAPLSSRDQKAPTPPNGCMLAAAVGGGAAHAEPSVAPCPSSVEAGSLAELERHMLDLINRERLDPANQEEVGTHGQALKWDDRLAQVARAHSADMAARHYFDHFSPDGSFPAQRVSRAGIVWLATGENIAKFSDVMRAEAAFMSEARFQSNHRSNILSKDFTHVGIGIARSANGMLYITQEFVQEP